jgi:peptidoglycan/LPS O-acetylase OafA/YrhL
LYPIYWCICAIVIPILFAYPTVRFAYGHETRWDVIVKSLVLFPQERPPVVGVAWTLQHEMLFYVLFGLLYVHKTLGWIAILAWQALVLGVNLSGTPVVFPVRFFSDMHNFQFLIGMALVPLVRRITLRHPVRVLWVGMLLFLGCGILEMHANLGSHRAFVVRCLSYGVASALILWGLVQAETAGRVTIPRPLVAIGTASYPIYLIHIVMIHALAQAILLLGLEPWLPEVVTFAVLSGGCVVAGIALSRYVERPLLLSLRKRASA